MTRRKVPTKEEIELMINSKETAEECSKKVGFIPATVRKYRRLHGYSINHYGDKEHKPDVQLMKTDMTRPVDSFLYGGKF